MMDGVAVGANDVVESVLRTSYVGACEGFSVTAQAIIQNLARVKLRESDDSGFAAMGLNVQFAGTMATLTSGSLRSLIARGDALKMRIFVESRPYIGMARAANVAADETAGSDGRPRGTVARRRIVARALPVGRAGHKKCKMRLARRPKAGVSASLKYRAATSPAGFI
jgi:hypothetical protein